MGQVNEGDGFQISLSDADDVAADMAAGLEYAFDCGSGYGPVGPASSRACPATKDDGEKLVHGKVLDKDGGVREVDGTVTVRNVAPTITKVTGTDVLVGPLAFGSSIFTTEFTDPASTDTWSADFKYSDDALESVSPFVTGQEVKHKFMTAGCSKSATVTVTDDDGGVSESKTASINAGTGSFLPPLADQPVADKLKNGQVLPVKVKITDCKGVAVTTLTPTITMSSGDLTTGVEDNVTQSIQVGSVSSADTGNVMRLADGFYMYNLRVNCPEQRPQQAVHDHHLSVRHGDREAVAAAQDRRYEVGYGRIGARVTRAQIFLLFGGEHDRRRESRGHLVPTVDSCCPCSHSAFQTGPGGTFRRLNSRTPARDTSGHCERRLRYRRSSARLLCT